MKILPPPARIVLASLTPSTEEKEMCQGTNMKQDKPDNPRLPDRFRVERSSQTLTIAFPSMLRYTGPIVDLSESFFEEHGALSPFSPSVVLREMLTNAIKHGNKQVPERMVTVKIASLRKILFKITVQDEGAGFDYRALTTKAPENPQGHNKRGYYLINYLSDSVEFNAEGNSITAFVTAK